MKRRTGHLFRRGNNWNVQWRVNGKLFAKSLRDKNGQPITSKREAQEAMADFMSPLAVADEAGVLKAVATRLEGRKAELAEFEVRHNPHLPITQAWSAFLASATRPDTGGETLYQYECQWSRFAEWMRENHPDLTTLALVTPETAAEYAASLRILSANTFNKHMNLLTLVFNTVKKEARLTVNVWEGIHRKMLAVNSRRELTVDELRRVCATASGELRTLIAVGVYTGMRLGDAATLRWCEVDLARNKILRVPSKTARHRPNGVLHIPIHPALASTLSGLPAENRGEYVMPETAALYAKRIDAVTDLIQAHFKKNGIPVHRPGTGTGKVRAVIEVGFHSLRHSFVSLCRASNVPLSIVESLVGHSNPMMTRAYTHTSEAAASLAVNGLPALLGDTIPAAAPKRDTEALLREARAIAESMTAENWQVKKAALLALAGA
jgi:integrase